MFFWTPSTNKIENFDSSITSNSVFSEQEKIKYMNLFFFFKQKKGIPEKKADILAQMAIYKDKYLGLKYSEEQETELKNALCPIFNH